MYIIKKRRESLLNYADFLIKSGGISRLLNAPWPRLCAKVLGWANINIMKAYAIMTCFFHIPVPCEEPKRDRTTAVVLSNTNGEVSLAILAPFNITHWRC